MDAKLETVLEWLRFSLFDLFRFQIFDFLFVLKKWLRKNSQNLTVDFHVPHGSSQLTYFMHKSQLQTAQLHDYNIQQYKY